MYRLETHTGDPQGNQKNEKIGEDDGPNSRIRSLMLSEDSTMMNNSTKTAVVTFLLARERQIRNDGTFQMLTHYQLR